MSGPFEEVSAARSFGGTQRVFQHDSDTVGTMMRVSVYEPPQAENHDCPVLWYLSGLTCTEENVTTKSGFQRQASERGIIVVCPDTSPRLAEDERIEGEDDDWDFGSGAGFYVDATRDPWSSHYRMFSYVTDELFRLVEAAFPVKAGAHGVTGHSMGGHGALICGLKLPDRYRSVSAFAPICHPSIVPWGKKAFSGYLGDDVEAWKAWDAVELLKQGKRFGGKGDLLVDQGLADGFLDEQLRPDQLDAACHEAGVEAEVRRQEGYDHSYYFVASFIADHINFHADRLSA